MRIFRNVVCALVALACCACGEDRSGEYFALIQNQQYIQEIMLAHYLWYDQITPVGEEEMIGIEPQTFFQSLLCKDALGGKGDKYSYLEVKDTTTARSTIDRRSTYGMEFEVTQDILQTTTHTLARVLYVLPGSPADKAGVQRGDWIAEINDTRITTNNYKRLMSGGEITLKLQSIAAGEDSTYIWKTERTVTLQPSVPMEENPIPVSRIFDYHGQRIAYLVYNSFTAGPGDLPAATEYDDQLKAFFTTCKQTGIDHFVLDLRYNSGGYLTCAQLLGSLLAPAEALGKDYIKLAFNDQRSPREVVYPFDASLASANLDLHHLFVLVSDYTASASEALINGLRPYMGDDNVILIGQKTEGKNVAMESFTEDGYPFTLWPVVAYVSNGEGEGDYTGGFTPQYQLNEHQCREKLLPLGDPDELFLGKVLQVIDGNAAPSPEGGDEVHALATSRPQYPITVEHVRNK